MATVISEAINPYAILNVTDKFNELVKASLDSENIYIRTKETIESMLSSGHITGPEKANVITQVLSNLGNSIVNSAMQTALAWEAKEKELSYTKVELEKKIDLMLMQIDAAEQSIKTDKANMQSRQAEILRMFGQPTVIDGNVVSLDNTGKTYQETRLITQEVANKGAEKLILDAKLKESNAAIHKIIADTYENYGYYNYTIGDGGVASVTKLSSHETLAANQKLIAKEQAKGYAYNAWSNAAQSSASMIGALVAAEVDGISSYVSQWSAIVSQLGGITTPTTTGL